MKCLKIGRLRCFFFLFSSFVSIVFCSLLLVSPSFAIEDLSVTFDSSSADRVSGGQVFYGTSLTSSQYCNDYKYIILDFSPVRTASNSITNQFNPQPPSFTLSHIGIFNSSYYSKVIYSIPTCYNDQSSNMLPSFARPFSFSSNFSSGESITITLTDKNPYDTSSCPVCPASPSGELAITSNGTYDVTNYASVDVDVPSEVVQGDYHNDLQDLKQSIIICGAILLVIYFFYCIYRMFFRTLGGV